MLTPPNRVGVWSHQQWQAAASPHRLQMLALLGSGESLTAGELAAISGRSAQSLYPHLDALVACGLVAAHDPDASSGRARSFSLTPIARGPRVDPTTGVGRVLQSELLNIMLRDIGARLDRYARSAEGHPDSDDAVAETWSRSELTWLTAERRAELNALMQRAMQLCEEGRAERIGRRTNVVLIHFPDVTLKEDRGNRRTGD